MRVWRRSVGWEWELGVGVGVGVGSAESVSGSVMRAAWEMMWRGGWGRCYSGVGVPGKESSGGR